MSDPDGPPLPLTSAHRAAKRRGAQRPFTGHSHDGDRGCLVQARGVQVERVLSDNGSAYKSHAWRDAGAELAITLRSSSTAAPHYESIVVAGWLPVRAPRT